jgi:hypothetical protein
MEASMKTQGRSPRNESGYALILAILALLLLTFLGLTLAATTSTELQIATSYKWSAQALYNAEAGIEAGKRILQDLNWAAVLPAARTSAADMTDPALPGIPFTGATRDFEMRDCDDRGHVGLGVVLNDGTRVYENVTAVPGLGAQQLGGAFTLWVRRGLIAQAAGTYLDNTDNEALVLTAMGIAPFVGVETGSAMRTGAARQILEVEVRRQGANPPCETRGGQASGGPEGNNYAGGCTGLDDNALTGNAGPGGFLGGTGQRGPR